MQVDWEAFDGLVSDGYANNNGVKIHYVTAGAGALVVLIHGFPDFWLTWRRQIPMLAEHYRVAAIDLRGYNLSDKPKGQDQYDMRLLVGDVAAVIGSLDYSRATIVGHDWGGAIAWTFAMHLPHMTERLVVLNLPHPRGLARELAGNPRQQEHSQYARDFQQEGAHLQLTPALLSRWVSDDDARARYVEAFQRSDLEAMLHYYKQNYPRPPYTVDPRAPVKVQASTLLIHGLADEALLAGALNDTWEWMERDLTLVTIPGAGHFVQQDAPELVNRALRFWLEATSAGLND